MGKSSKKNIKKEGLRLKGTPAYADYYANGRALLLFDKSGPVRLLYVKDRHMIENERGNVDIYVWRVLFENGYTVDSLEEENLELTVGKCYKGRFIDQEDKILSFRVKYEEFEIIIPMGNV